NYKKSNQVTDIVSEAGMYLRNAGEYERMFIETETQLRVVESLRNFVQNSSPTDLIPDNILTTASTGADSSPTLIAEYNILLLERARKLPSAGPENPNIKQLDAQLRALKQNVIANLDRLKSTLEIKKRDLQAQQRAVSAQISEVPTQEREYKGIVRQQNLKESLYLYLLQKREETAIALASTAPNAKIIDAALTATVPISPRVPVVYLGAFFLGCLIPFGVIYLRDLMDTKIHSHSDLESLSLPYLGDVPTSDSHNEIITLHSRTSTAEALRIIRTNLEFMLSHVPETVAKTIFVTSTIPKEGKTFVSINLAATIALSGKKVLLLAMDIRNPKFDEYLKIPQKGLTNYISTANSEPGDFIVAHDTLENLHIFPAGVIPPNPAELLMDNRVSELFVKLQQEYEYIIVDTAPVSLVTDTQIIAKFAHSFVYVTRANHLDKNMLAIPERLYRENKLPNMAIVLNDTNLKKGYGYGYGQAYGYTDNVNQKWYTKFFKKK
ncbi:MAG: polysaccharide biosynthesis tyrosine autokinase, partial [Flavobacterium sp.]|nr:polysaccharide biosynthesis tyrosine autokinase [Flavobacterium sp.]